MADSSSSIGFVCAGPYTYPQAIRMIEKNQLPLEVILLREHRIVWVCISVGIHMNAIH